MKIEEEKNNKIKLSSFSFILLRKVYSYLGSDGSYEDRFGRIWKVDIKSKKIV